MLSKGASTIPTGTDIAAQGTECIKHPIKHYLHVRTVKYWGETM